MIEFPCKCGFRFKLDDEQAGGTIQCHRCGLLSDIPLHQDLAAINEDGTYKMDESPTLQNPQAAADLIYVFTRGASDVDGYEKDLRLTTEEFDAVGTGQPLPLHPQANEALGPKYDPETGELITEFQIANDGPSAIDPATVPMATATLNYASGRAAYRPSFSKALAHLFSPPNLTVMFVIFCIHALIWPIQFILNEGFFLIVAVEPLMIALILSHYGNVVEDIGPNDKDDLPRPLRDLGFYEDLWLPFCNVFAAMIFCYWPLIPLAAYLMQGSEHRSLLSSLIVLFVALGTFAFPAALLTLAGSGTILNLRPDRVLRTIVRTGAVYLLVMIVWMVTALTYLWGFVGSALAIGRLMNRAPPQNVLFSWPLVVGALLAGIFFMHYLCICLGLIYRAHSHDFPWVLQRHVRTKQTLPPPMPPRRPRRAVARAPSASQASGNVQ
ncbi:MAG TPA: hypothetical protein VK797_01580 [Tepidisphaeraceae bacterium]|nr:hypothetical protein [Tepidisphaeraceae bacterium]